MEDLKALMARHARDGRVGWIGLRRERLAPMAEVGEAELRLTGLAGDHSRRGRRAVTLIQGEHLAAIGALMGRGPVAPGLLRRNIVVEGINLSALRGVPLRLGEALVRIGVVCAPCSRMEAALGHGGYNAMRGHGGWCAEVLEPGPVAIGARVAVEA